MCEHPFSALREFRTESISTNIDVLRACCGNCGVKLTKETMGRPVEVKESQAVDYDLLARISKNDAKQKRISEAQARSRQY